MAINFLQAKKKQRYLILILALIILAIVLIVWQSFFTGGQSKPSTQVLTPGAIEINWDTLKDAQIDELQLFEEVAPFEGEVGRTNPFIPY